MTKKKLETLVRQALEADLAHLVNSARRFRRAGDKTRERQELKLASKIAVRLALNDAHR